MMRVFQGAALAAMLMSTACIAHAPTTYELDRRAGFAVPGEKGGSADRQLRTSSALAPAARMPIKVPPVIEKVWVSDLGLSAEARLQGTWMFLEIEPGRWLDEVDPGGAPMVQPPTALSVRPSTRGAPTLSPEETAAVARMQAGAK